MLKSMISVGAAVAMSAIGLTPLAAETGGLTAPQGEVVLIVSGKIRNTNGADATARFDMPMLDALQAHQGTMETPWTKGLVTFKGPLGRALLDAVGSEGTVLRITALNDYAVDVPVGDLLSHDVILATTMDGRPMSVRDKGPLFLIYPFDKEQDLYNEQYFSRSAWQIKTIAVR